MFLLELIPPRIPWYYSQKGVGLVWVNFATFNFNYCKLINNPTSYFAKTQTTTTWSSSFVSTHVDPSFLNVVLPYKWLNNEVKGMFQCIVAFLDEIIPPSIASMASSSVSLVHLPLVLSIVLHLLSLICFLVGFCVEGGETFSLSCVACYCCQFHLLWGTFNIMI